MTFIRKDIRGNWAAEDEIKLEGDRVLKILTRKTSDGTLVTSATVHLRDGMFLSHRMFTDFSQRLMTAKIRCTEKAVAAQHAEAMTKLPELKEAVDAFYLVS